MKVKKNKIIISILAILLALSVVSIYVPLLFPPQSNFPPENKEKLEKLPVANTSTPTFSSSSTSSTLSNSSTVQNKDYFQTKKLPPSLSDFSSEEKTLNNLQKSLEN